MRDLARSRHVQLALLGGLFANVLLFVLLSAAGAEVEVTSPRAEAAGELRLIAVVGLSAIGMALGCGMWVLVRPRRQLFLLLVTCGCAMSMVLPLTDAAPSLTARMWLAVFHAIPAVAVVAALLRTSPSFR